MPVEAEAQHNTPSNEITAEQRHRNASAFIAEARAEIERLAEGITVAESDLAVRREPTQAEIDAVLAEAEQITKNASATSLEAQHAAEASETTDTVEVLDSKPSQISESAVQPVESTQQLEEVLTEEHEAAVHEAIAELNAEQSDGKRVLEHNTDVRIKQNVDEIEAEITAIESKLEAEHDDNELMKLSEKLDKLKEQLMFFKRRLATEPNNSQEQSVSEPGGDGGDALDGSGGNDDGNNGPPGALRFSYDRANMDADARAMAHMYAEKMISDDLEQGGRFKRLVKRAFKGNIVRQYYVEKYKQEYRQRVDAAGGQIYAPIEELYGTDAAEAIAMSTAAMNATLERVMNEDGRMRRDGEGPEEISGNVEIDNRMRETVRDLALRYANGELDDETLREERDRLFGEIEGLNEELFGRGVNFADNILELARNVRAEVEHGQGLDRVEAALNEIELRGTITRGAVSAELRNTIFDRLSKKVGMSRIGGTALASAIILGGAIVFSGTKRGAQSGLGAAMRLTGVGAFASGAITAGNEYAAFRREATFHRIESAYGIEHEIDANPRLRAMHELLYMAEDVPAAIAEIRGYIDDNGELRANLTDQELLDAQATATRLGMLMEQSDSRKIDLLRFSTITAAPRERMDLMQARIELEAAIAVRASDGTAEIDVVSALGESTRMTIAEALNDTITRTQTTTREAIDVDMVERDRAYKVLMGKRLATAFVAGSIAGLTIGTVVQEGMAAINPDITGVFEHQTPGSPNTLLNSLIFGQHNGGGEALTQTTVTGNHLITQNGSPMHLNVPNNLEPRFNSDHSVSLIDKSSGNTIVHNLQFGKSGELTPQSAQSLDTLGVKHAYTSALVTGKPQTVNAAQFYQANKSFLEHSRNTLMMNDTHRPDLNELHFYAAGEHGSWFDANGDVHVRVDGITPNGSFEGSQHVNPVEAVQKGQLKIFMSPDKAHAMDNFVFTVKPTGGHYEIVIPKTNPAHQLFGNRTGTTKNTEGFLGRYIGAAVDRGVDARGTHDFAVINSIEGTNNAHFTTIPTERVITTTLTFPKPEVPGDTLPVFGPPIYPRRGVGAPLRRRGQASPYDRVGYYDAYGGAGDGQEYVASVRSEISPRMRDDEPLDLATESDWYRGQIREKQGPEYLSEVEKLISENPELSSLPPQTKALVLIPVSALGEADNIYNTLSMWARQTDMQPGEFSLVLAVNNIEGQLDDPDALARIEKTKDEIERAKHDFPDIRIISVEFEIPKTLVEKRKNQPEGQGIIGDITRRLYDVAILASGEHVKKPDSTEEDILLIRSDADIRGLSPIYVDRMVRGAERIKGADAFKGEKQYGLNDPELRETLPGLIIARSFNAFLFSSNAAPERQNHLYLDGTNFAVRASSLAAVAGMGYSQYAGAGSDDVTIGQRLRAARNKNAATKTTSSPYGYNAQNGVQLSNPEDMQPIRYVAAAIDSDPSRLIGLYLSGGNPLDGSPWATFDSGPSGYRPRDADIPKNITPETYDQTAERSGVLISQMLKGWPRAEAELMLARFFGKSDRLRIETDTEGRVVRVHFTREGKKFIRGVVHRDPRIINRERGVLVSRHRPLLRKGTKPRRRWLTAN